MLSRLACPCSQGPHSPSGTVQAGLHGDTDLRCLRVRCRRSACGVCALQHTNQQRVVPQFIGAEMQFVADLRACPCPCPAVPCRQANADMSHSRRRIVRAARVSSICLVMLQAVAVFVLPRGGVASDAAPAQSASPDAHAASDGRQNMATRDAELIIRAATAEADRIVAAAARIAEVSGCYTAASTTAHASATRVTGVLGRVTCRHLTPRVPCTHLFGVAQDADTCACRHAREHPLGTGVLCPDRCSGHGVCDKGCHCDEGWGGWGCYTQLGKEEVASAAHDLLAVVLTPATAACGRAQLALTRRSAPRVLIVYVRCSSSRDKVATAPWTCHHTRNILVS